MPIIVLDIYLFIVMCALKAEGVLVLGVGKGTKLMERYLKVNACFILYVNVHMFHYFISLVCMCVLRAISNTERKPSLAQRQTHSTALVPLSF